MKPAAAPSSIVFLFQTSGYSETDWQAHDNAVVAIDRAWSEHGKEPEATP